MADLLGEFGQLVVDNLRHLTHLSILAPVAPVRRHPMEPGPKKRVKHEAWSQEFWVQKSGNPKCTGNKSLFLQFSHSSCHHIICSRFISNFQTTPYAWGGNFRPKARGKRSWTENICYIPILTRGQQQGEVS